MGLSMKSCLHSTDPSVKSSVAGGRILKKKKKSLTPLGAKGLEPFKQIQIHLKSAQARKSSQGLWTTGRGGKGLMCRSGLIWSELSAGHMKICVSGSVYGI